MSWCMALSSWDARSEKQMKVTAALVRGTDAAFQLQDLGAGGAGGTSIPEDKRPHVLPE